MLLIRILILLLCFSWILPLQAQDDLTPYEIALQRIEEARVSEATELDLSYLGLTELPPELWELTNLQWLSLSHNHIGNLSPKIQQLSNLQMLLLVDTQLESLPPEIGQLTNLKGLAISFNQLTNLPSEIGYLKNLCSLDISHNDIQQLPNTLGNLSQLTQSEECRQWFRNLNLDGNPLISPPQEVIAQGTPAILAYLRNQAWWHLQRMIIYAASVIGGLALLILGLRWRNARQSGKKKKNEV